MPVTATLLCLVIAVSDGDTLTARCNDYAAHSVRPLQVRVAGIDAPERKQAFGQASRQHLITLCLRQQASLQTLARDQYGRTIAHVSCSAQDVATSQVQRGLAWVYTRDGAQRTQLQPLQTRAREHRLGLWSQKKPLAPWTYRQRISARQKK